MEFCALTDSPASIQAAQEKGTYAFSIDADMSSFGQKAQLVDAASPPARPAAASRHERPLSCHSSMKSTDNTTSAVIGTSVVPK